MKAVIRTSAYNDYIAVDIVNEDKSIQSTPFYISNNKEIEVHLATPSSERCEYPSCYDDWYEKYMFRMEKGKLYVKWINGVSPNPQFSEIKPIELLDWRIPFANKIIIH